MKFMEIEFKYDATGINFSKFTEFCKTLQPQSFIIASGYDRFYSNSKNTDCFCRHRTGLDMNQLTFKRKTSEKNNYVRTEHNLDLSVNMSEDQVAALCNEFGYTYNTSIFKTCFIYKYDWYTLVYYICYDTEMKELGRFLEIEISEEQDWSNEKNAFDELVVLEKLVKPLGITSSARIKKSLYEMFKK